MFSDLTEKTFDVFNSYSKSEVKSPLFIAIPSKKNIGVSLSARILKDAWLNDLQINSVVFNPGDDLCITIPAGIAGNINTIKIYTHVVKINESIVTVSDMNSSAHFEMGYSIEWFREYAKLATQKKNIKYTNATVLIRWMNRIQRERGNPNAFSRFLELRQNVSVTRLRSKICFIPEQYRVSSTRDFLGKMMMDDALQIDESFVIKEDLEIFIKQFDIIDSEKNQFNILKGHFNNLYEYELKHILSKESEGYKLFEDTFKEINKSELDVIRINKLLQELEEYLINVNSDLADTLKNIRFNRRIEDNDRIDISLFKCLVTERIDLMCRYPDVINKILNLKIPVIVLFDYENYKKIDRDEYSLFISNYDNAFRFNWDRRKLNSIFKVTNFSKSDLDHLTHIHCHKYLLQKIEIISCLDKTNIIDEFFVELEVQGLLRGIEGFDRLKSNYVKLLRPILFWLKNSPGKVSISNKSLIQNYLTDFKTHYDQIRQRLANKHGSLSSLFDRLLDLTSNDPVINSKYISVSDDSVIYFDQKFEELSDLCLDLPKNIAIDSKKAVHVFTGMPLSEIKHRHLSTAAYRDFEDIRFLGFCGESEKFLKTIIRPTEKFNESLQDKLPPGYLSFWDEKSEFSERIIIKQNDCSADINGNQGPIDETRPDKFDYETNQYDLDFKYKYSENHQTTGESQETLKKVKLIELEGKQFLLLPRDQDRGIYVTKDGNTIESVYFDEIFIGNHVFTYLLSRTDNIAMREEGEKVDYVYETLDIWYVSLNKLFLNMNSNLQQLSNYLYELKNEHGIILSNPSMANLRNWLDDDRLINAPENPNLKLILLASGDDRWENTLHSIRKAERTVKGIDKANRESIRKRIEKNLKTKGVDMFGNFTVVVNDVNIIITYGKVKFKIEDPGIKVEQSRIGIIQKNI